MCHLHIACKIVSKISSVHSFMTSLRKSVSFFRHTSTRHQNQKKVHTAHNSSYFDHFWCFILAIFGILYFCYFWQQFEAARVAFPNKSV